MSLDADLLRGTPDAVTALRADFGPLLSHVLDDPTAPAPELVAELYRQSPNPDAWWQGVMQGFGAYEKAHGVYLRSTDVRKAFLAWLSASAEQLEAGHALRLRVRIDQARGTAGNLSEVQALYDSLDDHPAGAEHRGPVALMVAQRALEEAQPELAVTFATRAAEAARAAGDDKALDVAARMLAGAHMEAGDLSAAFAIYDVVLEKRGPMFGGGMPMRLGGAIDERASALQDMRVIGAWARRDTPEWVRALGSLSIVFEGDPKHGAMVRGRFMDAVEDLTAGPNPVDQLEVVIRQLDEREHFAASLIAAQIGSDAVPEDTWILSVYANQAARAGLDHDALDAYERLGNHDSAGQETRWFAWERAGVMATRIEEDGEAAEAWEKAAQLAADDEQRRSLRISMAEARAVRFPDDAVELARGVFDDIAGDPEQLAESTVGHRTVDILTRLLEARGDRAALEVQQRLLDAKRTLHGDDVPATWVEMHNLGAVHAGLGERDRARELVTEAHGKLLASCGPHHPYTQLCERTLARLEQES